MSNNSGSKSKGKCWICRENHFITNIAAIAGVIAIFLIMYQIKETKNQIIANFSYQFHKDGREIVKDMDDGIMPFFDKETKLEKYNKEDLMPAIQKVYEIIKFYASAFRLYKYGNIQQEEWEVIENELCLNLSEKEIYGLYWKKGIENNEKWSADFRQHFQHCVNN